MNLEVTKEERNLIIHGLQMRQNFIETGDPCLGAADLKNMKRDKEIKALNIDQMRLVVQIHDLITRLFAAS